jgi:sulfoxide reductase heme-binding subunit YedZ
MTGWYLMRATGIVALVLFTLVTVLGIATAARLGPRRSPRFVTLALHRNLSLLAVVFVGIHVATAILDPYARVSALAAVVPFTAHWRPLAVGLGTVSLDLVVALIVTSLLRRHLSLRLWRAVHLLAYVSWPVAVWHTIGAGSDWSAAWVRTIVLGCVAAVVVVALRRLPRPGRLPKHLAEPVRR